MDSAPTTRHDAPPLPRQPDADLPARTAGAVARMSRLPVWAVRLRAAIGVLLAAALVEFLIWRFFLVSTFYRQVFEPIAALVAVIALAALWRVLRPRGIDRRAAERRARERRDSA